MLREPFDLCCVLSPSDNLPYSKGRGATRKFLAQQAELVCNGRLHILASSRGDQKLMSVPEDAGNGKAAESPRRHQLQRRFYN